MLKKEVVNKNFELKRKILQIVFIHPNYDDIICVEISGSPLPHSPLLSKIKCGTSLGVFFLGPETFILC